MAKLAIRLKKMFDQAIQEKVISIKAMSEAKKTAAENINNIASIKELVDNGHSPIYAIYANTINMLSIFGEQITTLPPLHTIYDFIAKWQDIYDPSFPPISPISKSYFTCMTLLDAAFGEDKETVGTCFLSLIDRLPLDPIQIEAARKLNASRMGIYEVLQAKGEFFQLRELVTEKNLNAYIYSGYIGEPGDLIFVRLAPPLENIEDCFVGLTTPYKFIHQSRESWLQYFNRHNIIPKSVGVESMLYRHLKYGKSRTYWSEYIFYGYYNFFPGVILLTGFPDQQNTLPCHETFQISSINAGL